MPSARNSSSLKLANDAVQKKNYSQALLHYRNSLIESPELSNIINQNIKFIQSKISKNKTLVEEELELKSETGSSAWQTPTQQDGLFDAEIYSAETLITQEQIFDREWYTKTYNYSADPSIDWLNHYHNIGWKLGEDPSPLFSNSAYLNTEVGLREYFIATNQNPLGHYCAIGHAEKREIFFNPLIPFQQNYTTSSPPVFFAANDKKKFAARAAAFVHCYYIDIAEKIIEQCLSLGLDVHAAFVAGTEYEYLAGKFENRISYKVFENRGRDIAPFVTGFKDEIKKYEYAVHLHTKKSLHYGNARSDWMDYCLESLLGNISKIEQTFSKHRNVAIVFPEPPDFLKYQMNWGHNFRRVSALMSKLSLDLKIGDRLDFPAGSMFWFRTKDMLSIFELDVSPYLFEAENGQVDGTLAHAYERLFGMYALKNKKLLIPIRKSKSQFFEFSKNVNSSKLASIQEIRKSEETYNASLRHFYPELSPFSFATAKNTRPRINLLVPTIDPAHIFGGISTAIEFYSGLVEASGMDGRIISTDGPAIPQFLKKFAGYSCYSLRYCADADVKQILSGVPRADGDLQVRENDIFIATSWWSANHLKQISNFQKTAFGHTPKHLYLVQDYEPHFYGWSSKSQLADATYFNEWIKIYNTELLLDYFVSKSKAHGPSHILKPELNVHIGKELKKLNGVQKENIILVYGRPFAERNCNEILLEAISIWRAKNPNSAGWRIISLGQQYDHSLLSELNIEVLGKVDLEAYANLLAKSKIGLSLMVSPHPSYPPYEMLASGLSTYTNTYDNKLKICESDLLFMGNGSPEDIASFLERSTHSLSGHSFFDSDQASRIDFGEGLLMKDVITAVTRQLVQHNE